MDAKQIESFLARAGTKPVECEFRWGHVTQGHATQGHLAPNKTFVSGIDKSRWMSIKTKLDKMYGIKNEMDGINRGIVRKDIVQIRDSFYNHSVRRRDSLQIESHPQISQNFLTNTVYQKKTKYDQELLTNSIRMSIATEETLTSVDEKSLGPVLFERKMIRTTYWTEDDCKIELSDVSTTKSEIGSVYELEVELLDRNVATALYWINFVQNHDDEKEKNESTKEFKRSSPYFTKYEKARIIGVRAKEIVEGRGQSIAIDMCEFSQKMSNSPMCTDAMQIAIEELNQKKLPNKIQRMFPDGTSELWDASELSNPEVELFQDIEIDQELAELCRQK